MSRQQHHNHSNKLPIRDLNKLQAKLTARAQAQALTQSNRHRHAQSTRKRAQINQSAQSNANGTHTHTQTQLSALTNTPSPAMHMAESISTASMPLDADDRYGDSLQSSASASVAARHIDIDRDYKCLVNQSLRAANEFDALHDAHTDISDVRKHDFYKERNQVIDECDIVLQVLDARWPQQSRCIDVERQIIQKGKRLVLLLAKADLVTPDHLMHWKRYLTQSHACIVFKSNQKPKCVNYQQQWSFKQYVTKTQSSSMSMQQTSSIGISDLKHLLANYARSESGVLKHLKVCCIGLPNVSKSSIINTLIGAHKVEQGNKPGVTRHLQECKLDQRTTIIDSPGVLFNDDFPITQRDMHTDTCTHDSKHSSSDTDSLTFDDGKWSSIVQTLKGCMPHHAIGDAQACVKVILRLYRHRAFTLKKQAQIKLEQATQAQAKVATSDSLQLQPTMMQQPQPHPPQSIDIASLTALANESDTDTIRRSHSELIRCYNLEQPFTDSRSLLYMLSAKWQRILKGGVADIESTALKVVKDWCDGQLRYQEPPPLMSIEAAQSNKANIIDSQLLQTMTKEFNIDEFAAANESPATPSASASASSAHVTQTEQPAPMAIDA